ncbi:N-acetyl sugar amidotransferase [Thalassospira lohafexi]|uniref:LPS biosynthesis protein n=1 Tax=Thalassospira lohafexi TaxID=744227 RepID=A0A2N3LB74_9PROT|nr:N-acetyl sugar amidotransferase [Thalassospira lohafexi]PKR60042.1 LPS biosynthesis protein [Thalassospira lohafexi]
MRYCHRCLYPENHPLNLIIDDDGICSGCRVHEEKDLLDWGARFEELKRLVQPFKSRSGMSYDCIVPVSGARDSWFVVHVVKHVLGLRPLLVYYNGHYNTELATRNLAYMRQAFDCDLTGLNVSSETVKAVTRASIQKLGSIYWHVLAGQTVWPVRAAVQYRVPLIIWGAHQGIDQVGMFSHLQKVEMTRKYRKDHDLMGVEISDLAADTSDLLNYNTRPFTYPDDEELEAIGVRGIYLNNFLRWDTKSQNELMIKIFGYETAPQKRTFDTYSDTDSYHYSGLHDLIKYRKFGYGKVTDHASREIRLRRMTREQGLELVRLHQSDEVPEDTSIFCNWLGMPEAELFEHVDALRDPKAWAFEDGKWSLKSSVLDAEFDQRAQLSQLESWTDFVKTGSRKPDNNPNSYVLIGKGYVEGFGPESPVASSVLPDSCFGSHKPSISALEDIQ